ncbi:hypothetical protein, partial [Inquilinus limosus]|uniref:hypothetical protein n=1 Tax=Inquilinus limosus TaxID=171674 RepID=UPI001E512FD0
HTPLYEIQGWAGQGGRSLFDTLLVFENYPVDQALRELEGKGPRFGQIQSLETTNYALTLGIEAGAALEIDWSWRRAASARTFWSGWRRSGRWRCCWRCSASPRRAGRICRSTRSIRAIAWPAPSPRPG